MAILLAEDFEAIVLEGIPHHESVWLEIKLPKTSLVLGTVYRSPGAPSSYLENLQQYLDGFATRNCRLVIAGDFNLPGINWTTFSTKSREAIDCQLLLDMAFSHDLTQVVNDSTRENSILDLVFIDGRIDTYNVAIEHGLSDHKLVSVEISIAGALPRKKESFRHVRNFNKADDTSIIDYLSFSLDAFNEESDVNKMWIRFKEIVTLCINKFVPLQKKKENKQNPWMNRKIIHLKRAINRQRQKVNKDQSKIRKLSRRLRAELNESKTKYYEEILPAFMKSSPHRFWRHLSQKEDHSKRVHSLVVNGELVTDCSSIAYLHNRFCRVSYTG